MGLKVGYTILSHTKENSKRVVKQKQLTISRDLIRAMPKGFPNEYSLLQCYVLWSSLKLIAKVGGHKNNSSLLLIQETLCTQKNV
jgi:hypothetical protein